MNAVVLDKEDDVGLVRIMERTIHKDIGVIMTRWDNAIKVNVDDLKRVGVLSSEGHFFSIQRMNSLLGGAIWQLYTAQRATDERLDSLMEENIFLQKHVRQLENLLPA